MATVELRGVPFEARFADLELRTLAYDLKTPLVTLRWRTALVLNAARRSQIDPSVIAELEAMAEGVQDAIAVVDDLYAFGHDQSAPRLRIEDVDIVALVRHVIADLGGIYGTDITLQVRGDISRMKVDRTRVKRALVNVVENAIKYSPPEQRQLTVEVEAESDNGPGWVTLSVHDRGSGIAAPDLPRVFDPCFRGHNAAGVPGLGLGLAAVRRTVRLHGGEAIINARVGGGTSVTLRLPRLLLHNA